MSRIKCFFCEETGNTFVKCDYETCTNPDCGQWTKTYRRTDTGDHCDPWELPGAMFYVDEKAYGWQGSDGKCLVVVTPGGPWFVDQVASNCTRKDDKIHKCWVRVGVPPDVSVGKTGNSCAAGAGSILMTKAGGHKCDYHGFLRNGYLEEC